jgi:ribonucleotide reductase alpha subunit
MMTTTEILSEIYKLPPAKRDEIKTRLLNENESKTQISEEEFLQKLLAEGFISDVPEGMTDEEDDFETIDFEGEPVSETIIRERR